MPDDVEEQEFTADDFGRIELTLTAEPVSLQSRPASKAVFNLAMAAELAKFDFLIDCQVTLSVHWYGRPRRRWETDELPDLDNWLKPLIDSMVGPDRLFG